MDDAYYTVTDLCDHIASLEEQVDHLVDVEIANRDHRIKELEAELEIRRRNGHAIDRLFPGGYEEAVDCRNRAGKVP